MNASETQRSDPTLEKRIESARHMIMGCMGASFATCLVIASGLPGDVHRAMYLLVVSLPCFGLYIMVTQPGYERRYDVSRLMRITTVLGLFCMCFGLGFLFDNAAPGAGILFGITTSLCAWMVVQSSDRAIAAAKKKADAMKIAA
jgi:FtsH-binding integral membrane protein